MADQSTEFIPVTAQLAPALAGEPPVPGVTPPAQLDNPPRVRPIGAAAIQYGTADPFTGLSFVDVLNIRAAMNERLALLAQDDPQANAEHIASVKRVLALANVKLSPTPANAGLAELPVTPRPTLVAVPGQPTTP